MPNHLSHDLIFDDVVIKLTDSSEVSGDSCAAPLADAPVEVSALDSQLPREGSLLSGSQTGQGSFLRWRCCYCHQLIDYLLPDKCCFSCSMYSPEEIGEL